MAWCSFTMRSEQSADQHLDIEPVADQRYVENFEELRRDEESAQSLAVIASGEIDTEDRGVCPTPVAGLSTATAVEMPPCLTARRAYRISDENPRIVCQLSSLPISEESASPAFTGGHPTAFSAAMLGQLETVKA